VIVDLQNDFLPGGALPVPGGDEIVSMVYGLEQNFDLVVATQDWHPPNHGSFAASHPSHKVGDIIELDGLDQILWPVHCVQNSEGADFAPGLKTENIQKIFRKGTDPAIDSYSGFFDNGHRKVTGLEEYLRSKGVDRIFLIGLATDYCVKFTALDGVETGFETYVIQDATRAVNLQSDDFDKAIGEMNERGVRIVSSLEVMTK